MTTGNNKLVKDYLGNLVSKAKTHKIQGKYYVEGESCFLMEDGQWYRITSSDKIVFDHYAKKWVLKATNKLVGGIINSKGEKGLFSENEDVVYITNKRGQVGEMCLSQKVAESLGYEESIYDGTFYKTSNLSESDRTTWFCKKNIPQTERSKSYNLESDPERKKQLQNSYDELAIKISANSKLLAKFLGDFTIGMEAEVINGFIPKRIRNKFGIKALKDGSLRWDNGEGIEYVTVVMKGAKAIEVIRRFTSELTKRCEVNNLCAVHYHFGNVRKDKIFVLSLYELMRKIQGELFTFFPYSRFNSIKSDGKVYCKMLEDLNIKPSRFLNSKTEDLFRENVVGEFDKIYKWLNHGKGLAEPYGDIKMQRETFTVDGKKMFRDNWLRSIFTTKSVYHSIQGNKWDRNERYYILNFLNMFFTKTGTVEFRCHEGSTNYTKCIIWLLTCASILRYAENNMKECLSPDPIKLEDILLDNLGSKYTNYIMAYYEMRKNTFFTQSGTYRTDYKSVEKKWFDSDEKFSFEHNDFEIK